MLLALFVVLGVVERRVLLLLVNLLFPIESPNKLLPPLLSDKSESEDPPNSISPSEFNGCLKVSPSLVIDVSVSPWSVCGGGGGGGGGGGVGVSGGESKSKSSSAVYKAFFAFFTSFLMYFLSILLSNTYKKNKYK